MGVPPPFGLPGVLDKHPDSARCLWSTRVWWAGPLCHASGKQHADTMYAHNWRGGCLINAVDCLRRFPAPDESRQVGFPLVAIAAPTLSGHLKNRVRRGEAVGTLIEVPAPMELVNVAFW